MNKQALYGKKKVRIRKINDYSIKCENCGQYHQVFTIDQSCFHVFGIPFIPLGKKAIRCACAFCNDSFNTKKKEDYLLEARTPLFMFSGLILALGLIFLVIYFNQKNQRQTAEYIQEPMVGDVYLIKDDQTEKQRYYFFKLVKIRTDSLFLLHSYLEYDKRVTEMQENDYFVLEDTLFTIQSDLIKMHAEGEIDAVERYYHEKSRFHIEK
ncbi:MAG: hypothetical protein JW801_10845 [Bacteroidales bacterium]|nr:hypothetical protein [Bacteroidales bacterium]